MKCVDINNGGRSSVHMFYDILLICSLFVSQVIRREGIPDTIQYGKLLKELQKVVKHFTVSLQN